MKRSMMAAVFAAAALMAPAWAQSPAEHDSHHPTDSAKPAPAQADPVPAATPPGMGAQGGMGNMPMMSMMNDMKNMMSSMSMMNTMGMMQTAGMMGAGMGGITTIEHVEGRIAFLRAELRITDAQAEAWNGFADALRANARKLGEVRAAMMPKPGDAQQQAPTMTDRLDLQEKWLLARLDGTRAMKSAFAKLNESLSDEQKKTADDLLAPHMGMGMMAMMRSQMQPGQMQPGQMGPGKMQPGQMQMQQPGMRNK